MRLQDIEIPGEFLLSDFCVQESTSALMYGVCVMDRHTIVEIRQDNVQVFLCTKPHPKPDQYDEITIYIITSI